MELREIDILLKTFADWFDFVAFMETRYLLTDTVCASLNHLKVMKVEQSRMVPRNFPEKLELLIFRRDQ